MLPHAPTKRIIDNGAKTILLESAEDMRQLFRALVDIAAHDVASNGSVLEGVKLRAVDGVEEAGVADFVVV